MHKVKHMIIYFVKSVPECGKGILEISSVELWLSERLQLTSLFHLPDTVSTFLPWVFLDVTCKAACNKRHLSCLREFLQSPIYHCYLTLHSCHSYLAFLCSTLDFRGLFQASFTLSTRHTVPCDPRQICDPLCCGSHKCHPWLFLSLRALMDLCPQCFFLSWCICTSLFLFKLLSVSVYHAFDVQIFLLKPAKWLICFCSLFTSTFLMLLCL